MGRRCARSAEPVAAPPHQRSDQSQVHGVEDQPGREGWRIPLLLFCSGAGMASGGWFAGLLYDHFGYYAPAFAAGLMFNAVNLLLIGTLVWRRSSPGGLRPAMA